MRSGRWALALAASLWVTNSGPVWAVRPPELHLASLTPDGVVRNLSELRGRVLVLFFWQPNCAPCLSELAHMAEFRAASRSARLELVGLAPQEALISGLARARLDARASWRAEGDPAAILTAFGGAPARLPLTVALTPDGRICDHRAGLTGTRQVAEWVRKCRR